MQAFALPAIEVGRKWGCWEENRDTARGRYMGRPVQIRNDPWGWPNVEARGHEKTELMASTTA